MLTNKSTLKIKQYSDMEIRSDFIESIDTDTHKPLSIITSYTLKDSILCGIESCRTPHKKGFLVAFDNDQESNVGNMCGKKHLGADFSIMSNSFNVKSREAFYHEKINDALLRLPQIKEALNLEVEKEYGLRWLKGSLEQFTSAYPSTLITHLKTRHEKQNLLVTKTRKLTETEREATNSKDEYIEDELGIFEGLSCLTNNVLLTMNEFKADVSNLQRITDHDKLSAKKKASDFCLDIDNRLMAIRHLCEQGQQFFDSSNFDLFRHLSLSSTDKDNVNKVIWDFETNTYRRKKALKTDYAL